MEASTTTNVSPTRTTVRVTTTAGPTTVLTTSTIESIANTVLPTTTISSTETAEPPTTAVARTSNEATTASSATQSPVILQGAITSLLSEDDALLRYTQ